MNFEYNYNAKDNEILSYILSCLVFISTLYITLKLLDVNIQFSVIMFLVLGAISILYLINIDKYSIFKNDYILFLGTFYLFSLKFIFELLNKTWSNQLIDNRLIIISIIIWTIIYFLSILKTINTEKSLIFNYLIIIVTFLANLIIIMMMFSIIYINCTNNYIRSIINENFHKSDEMYLLNNENLKITNHDYLHYNELGTITINSCNKYFNQEQLNSFIKSNISPVNNIEDYMIFSAQNTLNGDYGDIIYDGLTMKFYLIFQKILFLIVLLFTILFSNFK